MITHVVYIDDSGTKEYAYPPADYAKPGGGGITPYFVFGGALLSLGEAAKLGGQIADLKREHFYTPDIEIKSNWLRQPQQAKKRYLDPYGLSEDELTAFVDGYYDLIVASDIKFIASVVDKQAMQDRYKRPWYSPSVAYEFLLQRVEMEMAHAKGLATIIIDDMHGATPKGNEYKDNLKKQHARLLQKGSQIIAGFTYRHIDPQLSFKDSATSHLVQVADIAAYNVFRQFRDHGADWEDAEASHLPTYEHFHRLSPKFCCSEKGVIEGYGVVKFPQKQKRRWSIKK